MCVRVSVCVNVYIYRILFIQVALLTSRSIWFVRAHTTYCCWSENRLLFSNASGWMTINTRVVRLLFLYRIESCVALGMETFEYFECIYNKTDRRNVANARGNHFLHQNSGATPEQTMNKIAHYFIVRFHYGWRILRYTCAIEFLCLSFPIDTTLFFIIHCWLMFSVTSMKINLLQLSLSLRAATLCMCNAG